MPERAIRFGIREGDKRAGTWKLWTTAGRGQSDVYLAARSIGGELKVSLHESGSWRLAFSEKAFRERVQGIVPHLNARSVEAWPRPHEMSPGVTRALGIVTPFSAVATPIGQGFPRDMIWLPNAPIGRVTEITLFLCRGVNPFEGWPTTHWQGGSLVGSFPLESGEVVFAVRSEQPMPDFGAMPAGRGWLLRGSSKDDLREGQLRAFSWGDGQGGSKIIYDCLVLPGPKAA